VGPGVVPVWVKDVSNFTHTYAAGLDGVQSEGWSGRAEGRIGLVGRCAFVCTVRKTNFRFWCGAQKYMRYLNCAQRN
jgi:hypothetical protein